MFISTPWFSDWFIIFWWFDHSPPSTAIRSLLGHIVSSCKSAEISELLDQRELLRDLHQRVHRKERRESVWLLGCLPLDRREVNELELVGEGSRNKGRKKSPNIIEFTMRNFIIELLHFIPRPITDADADDGEGIVGGSNNGIDSFSLIRHLAICNNNKNMILREWWIIKNNEIGGDERTLILWLFQLPYWSVAQSLLGLTLQYRV